MPRLRLAGQDSPLEHVTLMPTTYPFRWAEHLIVRLPPAGIDGILHIDVKTAGEWGGILVVDAEGNCIGVYVRRRVVEYPLPFEASEIEDVRAACWRHRLLAQIPFDPFTAALLTVFVVSPVLLLTAYFALPPLSVVSTVSCIGAIYVMYQAPGFPAIRLPTALAALTQAILGVLLLVRWLAG